MEFVKSKISKIMHDLFSVMGQINSLDINQNDGESEEIEEIEENKESKENDGESEENKESKENEESEESEEIKENEDVINNESKESKESKNVINEEKSTNKKRRVFECGLCQSKIHGITKCTKYRELKNKLTDKDYLLFKSNKLKYNEENGFCASGIIPYICVEGKVYLLVLVEKRYKKIGLNFIGGKRECVEMDNDVIVGETSYQTALNEFEEELGEILTTDSMNNMIKHLNKCKKPKFVFWSGGSKMCIYGIKFPEHFLNSLELNNLDKTNTEAEGFKWIEPNIKWNCDYKYVDNGQESNVNISLHSYSKCMLSGIKKLAKNKNLYTLFR
jgi:8-oxo-dGTP pyrophosphatase MutT (NUDIX family)